MVDGLPCVGLYEVEGAICRTSRGCLGLHKADSLARVVLHLVNERSSIEGEKHGNRYWYQ